MNNTRRKKLKEIQQSIERTAEKLSTLMDSDDADSEVLAKLESILALLEDAQASLRAAVEV